MKILKFSKSMPNGEFKGVMRFDGKLIYFKFNASAEAQGIIQQLKNKGAIITPGRNWIRVNMFADNDLVKMGDSTFNVKEQPEELTEQILFNYFSNLYAKGGFILDTK